MRGRNKKKGTVGLLTRTEIAVKGVMQQTPAHVDKIAPGCQHLHRRRVSKKAAEPERRRERPHTVRTQFRPGTSQVPLRADPHVRIVGQQDKRHGRPPCCLCPPLEERCLSLPQR